MFNKNTNLKNYVFHNNIHHRNFALQAFFHALK